MTRLFLCLGVVGLLLSSAPVKAAEQVTPATREQVTLTFAPVVKRVAPAVVNIYTSKVVQTQAPALFNDPFFRQFFGDQLGMPRERVQNSLGSGVIVRSSGIVITNSHVAADADQIRVVLSDRREFEAKIVGKDDRSDLAVLQLQGVSEPLPALELPASDAVEVGDMVLAIGNPFGVGQTVTSGIISALARTIGTGDIRSFIQTDAAINPGNSGGALITSDGRLIGINTQIFSNSGANIGIGFAIPSAMVRTVMDSILKEGRAIRPWLGASGKTIDADLAKNLSLPRPTGVLVDRVAAGSPADKAGLKVGDIVRSVNGRTVNDAEEMRYVLATLAVGEKATVGVTNLKGDNTLTVSLQAAPDTPARKRTPLSGRQPFAGAIVANLNPALAEELNREFEKPEVIILEIARASIAANMGLQPGDIVMAVNDEAVKNVDDLVRLTSQQRPAWIFNVNRGGQTLQFRAGG